MTPTGRKPQHPEMQNVFPRTPEGKMLRRAMHAQRGWPRSYTPGRVDYSEIEARVFWGALHPNRAPDMADSDLQQPTMTLENGSGQS